MPLANSGDPWRAQISNTNATVVSNVVSFKFIIEFLFFCLILAFCKSFLFCYDFFIHVHSSHYATFIIIICFILWVIVYPARMFKTFARMFALDGIFVCFLGDSEIYPLKLYHFYLRWKCISCVNQYHIIISFTSKNRYFQRRIHFDQFSWLGRKSLQTSTVGICGADVLMYTIY